MGAGLCPDYNNPKPIYRDRCSIWKLQLHDWASIMSDRCFMFQGEPCVADVEVFRKCRKCGIIQEQKHTMSSSFYWEDLNSCETKIVEDKLTKGLLWFKVYQS